MFDAINAARDAASALAQSGSRKGTCGDGRSIARPGTCSNDAGYAERILHRPGHIWDARSTVTAFIWMTTKTMTTGGFFLAPDLPSSPDSISTRSAFARKSTYFSVSGRPWSPAPSQTEILKLG